MESPATGLATQRSISLAQLNGRYTRKRYDYTAAGLPIWKNGQGPDPFLLFWSVSLKAWVFSSSATAASAATAGIHPGSQLSKLANEVAAPAQDLWALKGSSMEMLQGESAQWACLAHIPELLELTIRVQL